MPKNTVTTGMVESYLFGRTGVASSTPDPYPGSSPRWRHSRSLLPAKLRTPGGLIILRFGPTAKLNLQRVVPAKVRCGRRCCENCTLGTGRQDAIPVEDFQRMLSLPRWHVNSSAAANAVAQRQAARLLPLGFSETLPAPTDRRSGLLDGRARTR